MKFRTNAQITNIPNKLVINFLRLVYGSLYVVTSYEGLHHCRDKLIHTVQNFLSALLIHYYILVPITMSVFMQLMAPFLRKNMAALHMIHAMTQFNIFEHCMAKGPIWLPRNPIINQVAFILYNKYLWCLPHRSCCLSSRLKLNYMNFIWGNSLRDY